MIKDFKIAIIGPYPPPYGGISVHIERILKLLPESRFDFYNTQKKSVHGKPFYGLGKYFYILFFLFAHYKIIHYHSTSKKIRLLLSVVSYFKKNVFLHLHGSSFSDTLLEDSFISRKIKLLIPNTNFIASNKLLFDEIKLLNPKSIHLFDAFIPPFFKEDDLTIFRNGNHIPQSTYIICMVGWFTKYKGEDLYGFDLALETLNNLINNYKLNLSIIASVNGINDNSIYQDFILRRKELKLENNFILLLENRPKEIYPLFLLSHMFIRPTNTDGNSVSIKEALWFETPAIASDVVPRPAETYLFKNRSAENLKEMIFFVIKKHQFLSVQKKIELSKTKKFKHPIIKEIYGLE